MGATILNILIVEDDPDIIEVIALCLETQWPAVILLKAGTGATGLSTFAMVGADLVILDLGLPDMDGLEVCRQIRQKSDVPILIATVRDHVGDAAAAILAGASAYLTKPFAPNVLLSHVQKLLGVYRP